MNIIITQISIGNRKTNSHLIKQSAKSDSQQPQQDHPGIK